MMKFLHGKLRGSALLLTLLLLLAGCKTNETDRPALPDPTTVATTVVPTPTSTAPPATTPSPGTIPPATTPQLPVSTTPENTSLPDLPITTPDSAETTAPDTSHVTTPVTEPMTTPVTEPITQPVTEPVTAPVTQPDPVEPTPTNPYAELKRNAQHVLLYDVTAGKTLYSTGDSRQVYPASTTKLLTLLYALTIVEEDAVFTVGNEINMAPWDSSKANIRVGERYTCTDLVAALLLPSGNDAAYTLAVSCGRILADDPSLSASAALSRFMSGLNEYAASLGLTGTHFVTPDGYHDDGHVTTVGDLLQIALLAKAHPLLSRIMATPSYQVTDLAKGRQECPLHRR